MSLRVYIGYDSREPESYRVAEKSLKRNASIPVEVIPLDSRRLAECGLLRRPTDLRGQRYDIFSNAPASTEFAISRFLVPILAQTGWALFCDSDVVFLGDVAELLSVADDRFAVQVVKHPPQNDPSVKMDGQTNLLYSRKNWSSVCLWNIDHPANKRLSLVDIQERPGRYLHAFEWLHDSEIGSLPEHWNVLVGLQEKPEKQGILHYTLGTPELGIRSDLDEYWYEYADSKTAA
jgi:hypothetical protein